MIHVTKWFAHAETPHTLFWNFSTAFAALGHLGVPLFFMISGALLLNKIYEPISFLKRRYTRIFIPFFFWIAVAVLYRIFLMGYGHSFYDIINIIFDEGYVWYIWTLAGIYLFIPVINPFINKFQLKGAEYYLIIWLITFVFSTLSFKPFRFDLTYFTRFFGYLILGWYLTNKEFKASDKSIMTAGLLIFIISTIISLYILENQIDLGNLYFTPIQVFQASGIFLFIKYSAKIAESGSGSLTEKIYYGIKESKLGKLILSLSLCSYGIYLTHYMFIWIFFIYNDTYHFFSKDPFIWIPATILFVLIGSWLLIWIFSKIPYLKKVSGI